MVIETVTIFFAQELIAGAKERASENVLGPVWDYVDSFFPTKDNEFEKQTAKTLANMSKKIDMIQKDVAYARISAARDAYGNNYDYLTGKLGRFLKEEAKLLDHRNDRLKEFRLEVSKRCGKLHEAFNNGIRTLNDRITTFDFPSRILFEYLQKIAALELVYLSWEYFLTKSLPQSDPIALDEIQDEYIESRDKKTKEIKELIERICKARLDLCSFTYEIDKMLRKDPYDPPSRLKSVQYTFKDSFSSDYADDPFRGEEIGPLKPSGGWDVSTLIDDYRNFKICGKEHRERLARLEQLNNTYIREPAYQFLAEINQLPYFLSKDQASREIEKNNLPVDWDKSSHWVSDAHYKNKHPLLAKNVSDNQARNAHCKGNRLYFLPMTVPSTMRRSFASYAVASLPIPIARLDKYDYLESSNQRYKLIHSDNDCVNLVCAINNQLLWCSETFFVDVDVLHREKGGEYLELQNDGNLVMYNKKGNGVWSTGTDNQSANMLIHLNGDVSYAQAICRKEYLLSAGGKCKLLLNEDGRLVLSDTKSGAEKWTPKASAMEEADELRMQEDGNLVLYKGCGKGSTVLQEKKAVWATDTHGKTQASRGGRAVLEDWGDLVVYNNKGSKLWSSADSVTDLVDPMWQPIW